MAGRVSKRGLARGWFESFGMEANFRSRFGRILQTASVDELMRKLREKGAQG